MRIRKLRCSWCSTSAVTPPYTELTFVSPGSFHSAWGDPRALHLADLRWSHPWQDPAGNPVEPDRSHWSWAMEGRAIPSRADEVSTSPMLRQAVPLRAPVTSSISLDGPPVSGMAEILLQPWAATAAITATVELDRDATLDRAVELVDDLESAEATIDGHTAPLVEALAEAAEAVATTLRTTAQPPSTVAPGRIVTVIDAELDDPLADHTGDPSFCFAMHRLAGVTAPGLPFRWVKSALGGEPQCISGELRVVLRSGVSQWCQGALLKVPKRPLDQTTGLHRRALLQWSTLAAIQGLLEESSSSGDPNWFETLREDHSALLGRLYGPSRLHLDWLAQAYVKAHAIERLMSNPRISIDGACPPQPAAQ